MERRSFHARLIYGLWGIIGTALGAPAGVYLLGQGQSKKNEEWVEATDLTHLRTGVPEEVIFRRNRKDGWKLVSERTTAWVVKRSDQEVVAFAPQCTHLGCAYHWDERRKNFLCPCHTSTFSLDGKVLEGPAPRALDLYASCRAAQFHSFYAGRFRTMAGPDPSVLRSH